jgi:SAM-dependent methyltransferase
MSDGQNAGGPSDPRFWQQAWARPTQGWEIGEAAPPLARWFAAHPPAGKRALVVGCGRGHEARLLAAGGAEVVAIDFTDEALLEARALAAQAGLRIDFRRRDLFRIGEDPERYDLIVEHCCFCAIDPARRGEYVEAVAGALVDGGELVGLFRTRAKPDGGPPFATLPEELERLFAPRFVLAESSVPADSVEARRGGELLVQLKRR